MIHFAFKLSKAICHSLTRFTMEPQLFFTTHRVTALFEGSQFTDNLEIEVTFLGASEI
jgi:hypothetical protein